MASPLEALMALFQAKKAQPSQVRPDYGLTGAMLSAQRSPYERTMAPGEQRSAQDLQSMLGEVILAAGAGASPVTGPRGVELARTAARVRPGGEAAFNKWFAGSRVADEAGNPLTVYHGTPTAGFSQFDRSRAGKNTRNKPEDVAYHFTDSQKAANYYSDLGPEFGSGVMPVHLALKNPLVTKERVINRADIEAAKRAGHDGIIAPNATKTGNEYIVFRESQIKSATGNRGTYNPNSGDIRE